MEEVLSNQEARPGGRDATHARYLFHPMMK